MCPLPLFLRWNLALRSPKSHMSPLEGRKRAGFPLKIHCGTVDFPYRAVPWIRPVEGRGVNAGLNLRWFFVRRAVEGVRVLKTLWKHHKSKEHIFQHRSYIPIFFSTSKKNIFFGRPKYFSKMFRRKKNREKNRSFFFVNFFLCWNFRRKKYFPRKFSKKMFWSPKKNFFLVAEFFFWISISK